MVLLYTVTTGMRNRTMRGYWLIAAWVSTAAALSAQNTTDELIQAIRQNDLAGIKTRLAKDTDVNSRDARETTLLMHASAIGSPEAVKLLLDSGADVNAMSPLGSTALTLAADQPEKAALLIAKGANVNAATKLGRTPLMIASHCDGCSATVKLLLDKGANVKARDGRNHTPIVEAASVNDLDTVKILLAAGAEPDIADDDGYTPLMWAASSCNLEMAKLLLARKVNVNAANKGNGEVKFGKIQLINLTPLMLGSTFCSADMPKLLLEAGAKVNATDIRGMTPLMFAVSSESQKAAVVKTLLAAGADVNAKSTVGETALNWARKFGHEDVMAALSAAGAKEGVTYNAPERKAGGPRTAREAVEVATALLQKTGTEFFKQSGCVGCHHQPSAVMATSAARRAGVKVDEGAAVGHIKMAEGQTMALQQFIVERLDVGGAQDPWMMLLMAMNAERYPSSRLTDTILSYVASGQLRDGSWFFGGVSRAPSEEGHFARTAYGLRVMQLYGTPAMKADLDRRIARARDYLLRAKATTNDEAAMQILGLHWAGGNDAKVRSLAKSLLAAQHADGGWSQNREQSSDAYATGETLWALTEAGVLKASDATYQKGAKYLLDSQWADGSWYVRSRAPKFQPYFQSGFPFDHDQWISSTATSLAVRGLAPAVENEKRASR
jgi:ankyrin repeat protein